MAQRPRRYAARGILCFALVLVGCSSGSGAELPEPELGEIPVIDDPSELVLPLDAYMLGPEEYVTVRRAAWLLTKECVRRFGAEYTVTEAMLLSDVHPFDTQNEGRYGLFNAESATAHGYNVPDDPALVGSEELRWDPSQTELLLVRGGYSGDPPLDINGEPLPEDGCQGEATRMVNHGVPAMPADLNLPDRLSHEAYRQSEVDSRVEAAMGAWSSCMGERGYSYESIWEPNDYDWPEIATEEEIAVATADVACKEQTNLVGVWFAAETAYQQRIIDGGEHAQALRELKEYVEVRKRNTSRIIAEARG